MPLTVAEQQAQDLGVHVEELSPALGVEVRGLDLSAAVSDADADALRVLLTERKLIVVRDQQLTDDEHLRFCEIFAPAHRPVGYVSNTELAGFLPEHLLLFHSDFAFTGFPVQAISLHALELADGAAPTQFTNTELAYEQLPADLRARLDDLELLILANTVDGREDIPARTVRVPDDAPRDRYIRTVVPVVGRHRVNGRPFLFVSEQQASHLVGLSLDESDRLLDAVFAHLRSSPFVYEHQWRVGDLAIWDNMALQHGRRENRRSVRRCLRRITMSEKSMLEILDGTVYARSFLR